MAYVEKEPRWLRPQNDPARTPGRGSALYRTADGRVVKVVNVMCRLFMELLDDPFAVLEQELPPGPPKRHGLDAVIVDVHGEATSEKMAIGHVADGRARSEEHTSELQSLMRISYAVFCLKKKNKKRKNDNNESGP